MQFQVRLHHDSFQSFRCDAPSLEVDVTKDMLVDMYDKMVSPWKLSRIHRAFGESDSLRLCHLLFFGSLGPPWPSHFGHPPFLLRPLHLFCFSRNLLG